jgi:CubicO group peptidase (beta-lactamase class C family)
MAKVVSSWRAGLLVGACLALAHSTLSAADLPRAQPEEVGLSSAHLANLDRVLESSVQQNKAKGLVAGVVRNGRLVYLKAVGERDVGKPMTTDTIFRICSMTKAITAVAAMILFEEGRFTLDEPLATFIPEFAKMQVSVPDTSTPGAFRLVPAEHEITIGHLLTHTAGFTYSVWGRPQIAKCYQAARVGDSGSNLPLSAIEVSRALATCPLTHQPGTRFEYGLSMDVLGVVIESISGMSLDRFFHERVLVPLGMSDTHFYLPDEKVERLAAVFAKDGHGKLLRLDKPYERPSDRHPELIVEIFDPRYPFEGPKMMLSGGAGLSSTAIDYLKFCQMLLNDGRLNGARLLGPQTVKFMTRSHAGRADLSLLEALELQGSHPAFGGQVVQDQTLLGHSIPEGTYFWGGYYCTSFDIDFQNDLAYVLMTQREPTSAKRDHSSDWKRIQTIVHAAIIDQ